jgi:membrane protease YdiL (CAAX protease family)
MTWRVEGRPGLKDLWSRATRFNLGWKWYLTVVLIPILAAGLSAVAYLFRGGAFVESPLLIQPLNLIGFTVLIFLGGPISEEFGWRGFALDRLLTRWNAMSASLILGVLWALWHLPLFFIPGTFQQQYGDPVPGFIVFAPGVIGRSVVYTWLHLGTRRSLWAAILYHAVSNYTISFLATLMSIGLVEHLLIECVYILIAAIIVISWQRDKPETRGLFSE